MTSKLSVIKDLRDKGATIKMIDDVAEHVGSYDNPAFVATVDLILKIKNSFKSQQVEQEQAVELSGESLDNVNLEAAQSAITNDDDLSDDERKKALQSLKALEQQQIQLEMEQEMPTLAPKDGFAELVKPKGKRDRETAKAGQNSIIEKNKAQIAQAASKNIQKQNQIQEVTEAIRAASKQVQQNQARQQTTSVTKMNLIKMKLLSALKVKKDTTVYGNEQWRASQKAHDAEHKPEQQANTGQKHDHKHGAEIAAVEAVVEAAVVQKQAKQANLAQQAEVAASLRDQPKGQDKGGAEVLAKLMEAALKNGSQKKPAPHTDLGKSEKGKFASQVEDKKGPRANEENVAKMQAQEAIAALKNSGAKLGGSEVKPTNQEIQAAQQASQSQQAPKQR